MLAYQAWLERFRLELNTAQLQGWITGPTKTRLEADAEVLYRARAALDPERVLFPILQVARVIEE